MDFYGFALLLSRLFVSAEGSEATSPKIMNVRAFRRCISGTTQTFGILGGSVDTSTESFRLYIYGIKKNGYFFGF